MAETGGRKDLWRVRFADALNTRVYLNGQTGEFVTSRNDAWVRYDFIWRLDITDYADGEDFNGTLRRVASVTAFGLGRGRGSCRPLRAAGARQTVTS